MRGCDSEVVRREVATCEVVRMKSVVVNGTGVPFQTAGEGSESVARVGRLESEPCEVVSLELEVERCRKLLHWLRPSNLVGMETGVARIMYCGGFQQQSYF